MRALVALRLGCHICQPGKLDEAAFLPINSPRKRLTLSFSRGEVLHSPLHILYQCPYFVSKAAIVDVQPTLRPGYCFTLQPLFLQYNLFGLWGAFFDHLNTLSYSLCSISIPASLSSYSTSSRTITLPYTSLHYSIIVEGSANKVDNIIQVGMKSLKKKPESDNSLSIPLSPAPLHSSPQRPMPFSPAHLQMGDARVLNILPSSALSPSKNLMSRWPHYAIHSTQAFSVLISKQASSILHNVHHVDSS